MSRIMVVTSSGTSYLIVEGRFIFVTILFGVARFTHVVAVGSARTEAMMATTIHLSTYSFCLPHRKFFS